MEARPEDDPRATWTWIAVGCGGLALSLFCLVPPLVWFALEDDAHDEAAGALDPSAPVPAPVAPSLPAPSPGLPVPTTRPRRVTAIVEHVSGSIRARPGTTILFDVTREEQPDGTFWCNAQVRAAGQLLYGGQSAAGQRAGFFDCTLYEQPQRHVVGEDANTSGGDGDAAIRLDTLRGVLSVRDDRSGPLGAFTLRARVTGVE